MRGRKPNPGPDAAPPNGGLFAFYALKPKDIWAQVKNEHFSFWMISIYLVFEYVRPQSIVRAIDILPWAQVFLLLSLVGRMLDREARWVRDQANVWITMFLCVILFATVFATYPDVSTSHLKDFIGWYVIYFLIINIVTNERRFLFFLLIFIFASFKLSFFGARTWAMRGFAFTSWGLMGPPGFFQNSGELAIQMLMFSPIAYEIAVFSRGKVGRWVSAFWFFAPLTAAMTVMGASSRGSQVALIYQAYRHFKSRINFKSIVAIAVVAAIGWAVFPAEQKARFSSVGQDRTSQQRLLYWKHGIEMIREHPILGVGYFNFAPYFQAHFPEDVLYQSAQLPHNIFVQVGTDAGLVGLAVFGMILYRNFRTTRQIARLTEKSSDTEAKLFAGIAKGLAIALWGFIVAGQFVTVTYYPFLWINLALTVALHNIVNAKYASSNQVNLQGRR